MTVRVFIKHGDCVSYVVSVHGESRYYAGAYLPETRKVIPEESGKLRKSPEDTAAALFAMGYVPAPIALDPLTWIKDSTSGEATQEERAK